MDADAVVQLKRKGKVYLTDVKAKRVYIADIGNYSFTALNENDPVRAVDIAFDETNQKLFWIDSSDNRIYRGNWDMAESISVSSGHSFDRASISLNEREKQIFCVFHGGSKISRIDHDNPNTREDYVLHYLQDPSNIIVAEDIGYLYFTQNRRIYILFRGIADDIVVFGKSEEEYDQNLNHLMSQATKYGLQFNSGKCSIKVNQVAFFGMMYDAEGVHPDPHKA
nr:uncharacterized protein LOC129270500 [Lytechinus pictus]